MSQTHIILQARVNSSRLPGKVLLPVNGIPLVVLSARRAANSGLPVLVATSEEATDDVLAEVLQSHNIPHLRGSLEDVHARFLKAAHDLADDDWVIRLTGDNLFPDGKFIEALRDQAEDRQLDYLGTNSITSGLPYGMSAEIFHVKCLRENRETLTDFDREHVTPAIRRAYGEACYQPADQPDLSHLRCTVDTFDDYMRATSIFRKVDDATQIPADTLISHLIEITEDSPDQLTTISRSGKPLSCLTLGTAQIGLENYGHANQSGQPTDSACQLMVEAALDHGFTHIDCARAYGTAERRISTALAHSQKARPTLITKLDPLPDLDAQNNPSLAKTLTELSVYRSCTEFSTQQLDVLMLHRWAHRQDHGGAIWNQLLTLQKSGLIQELGASISTQEEALEALADPDIKHLQIPCHLGDHRWTETTFLEARAARPDILVYGRSAFLQGLLLSPPDRWPTIEDVDPNKICQALDELVHDLKRESRADLCLAYARSCGAIDSAVLGQESLTQLIDNIKLASLGPLDRSQCHKVRKTLPVFPAQLLDPSQWPQ